MKEKSIDTEIGAFRLFPNERIFHSIHLSSCCDSFSGVRVAENPIEMKESKQIEIFQNELEALIQRYAEEFDLTVASMVGVLEVKIHELIHVAINDTEDEDEEDEEDEETFS